jgi:DNA gyrase/topoisomerase IV subunit A
VFDRPGFFSRADRCDEIWMHCPSTFPNSRPCCGFLNRCPVHEIPYIWSPQFLMQRVAELEKDGYSFGYTNAPDASGHKPGLRVAIFEPNVSVVKTSSISMLVCDEAFRAASEQVDFMHVLNTLHFKDHPTLLYLANSLDLVKQQKAVFQGRHDFAGYMVQHANAVVSHQWLNDQNYSYLDALYGNYP